MKIRNSITQIRENRTHGNDKIQWDEINWTEVYKLVNRLQTRIAKATQEKNIQRKLLFFSKNRTRRSQVSAFSPGLTFLGTACIRPADFVRQLRVCDALRNVPAGIRRTFAGSSRPCASMNHSDLRAWSLNRKALAVRYPMVSLVVGRARLYSDEKRRGETLLDLDARLS